ncbi:hypothetical protein CPB86DRAFT_870294 [Serendipita vermifera]|nr:hypothetical protein CPB86DRAFT_870294 [Serendipita vermifera]
MDGSPPHQNSQRSRPNYPHPILLEDGRSRAATAGSVDSPLNSPSSIGNDHIQSEYDPEIPYPHTDNPYGYVHGSENTEDSSGLLQMGRNPSSSSIHHGSPPFVSGQHTGPGGQIPSPSFTSPFAVHGTTQIPPPPGYYQGVIPFSGSHPASQHIPVTPAPSGVGFVCQMCNMTFTRAHDLRRHYTSKHAEVKCKCLCGKHFSRKDALLRHQRPDPVSGYGGCDEAQNAAGLAADS